MNQNFYRLWWLWLIILFLALAVAQNKLPKDQSFEQLLPDIVRQPQKDQSQDETVLVARVIDGDTVEVESGERVRYLGIDTPETVDPRRPEGCFGKEASAKNKELVEGRYVRLENDITDRDKYGRLLRYIYVDDKFVNLELVKGGYAVLLTLPPDVRHTDELLAAQKEAREAKRGLWGVCTTL